MKRDLTMFLAGIGSVIMYEQIKSGKFRNMWRDMKNTELRAIEELENMMK